MYLLTQHFDNKEPTFHFFLFVTFLQFSDVSDQLTQRLLELFSAFTAVDVTVTLLLIDVICGLT